MCFVVLFIVILFIFLLIIFSLIINNCIFEGGFCFWINFKGDNFDWIRSKGGIVLWNIGLIVDYILGIVKGIFC